MCDYQLKRTFYIKKNRFEIPGSVRPWFTTHLTNTHFPSKHKSWIEYFLSFKILSHPKILCVLSFNITKRYLILHRTIPYYQCTCKLSFCKIIHVSNKACLPGYSHLFYFGIVYRKRK